jgi:hypothetical protein
MKRHLIGWTVLMAVVFAALPLFADISKMNGVSITTATKINGAARAKVNGVAITSGSYVANTAVFDGADWMRMSAVPTGLADSKVFTCSFWVKFNGGNGSDLVILNGASSGSTRFMIYRTSGNKLGFVGRDSGGSLILFGNSNTNTTSASGWVHYYICIDLANSALSKIYRNGADDTPASWTVFTDAAIDFAMAAPTYTIGAQSDDTTPLNASVSEFWFNDGYLDAPTQFASGGHPIAPPAGAAMYYSQNGSGNSWATDSSGNGNTMTVTGPLGTDTAP